MVSVTLMPIGRFATASRLSVKSLRNYDQSGLLPAAVVDPQSGYRYYRVEQLARAQVIHSLRILDMPLAQIADIVDGGDSDGLLESHLAELVRQRDDYDKKVRELRDLRSRREITMSNTVTVKFVEAQQVASYRTTTSYADVFTNIPAGFGRVLGFLGAKDVDPAGAPFVIFHQAPEADADGEVAMVVPVAGSLDDLAGEAAVKQIEFLTVQGGPVASIIHRGSYASMGDTYASVGAWIHEHGHSPTGPGREIYMNNPGDVAEEDLLTEIQWPIDAEDLEGFSLQPGGLESDEGEAS